jgi:hypothetical protein
MTIFRYLTFWKTDPLCWFYQGNTCIVHSCWWCLICPWRIREISGLNETKDYLDLVNSRRLATRALIISIITIIIAVFAVFISLLGVLFKDVDWSEITSVLGF